MRKRIICAMVGGEPVPVAVLYGGGPDIMLVQLYPALGEWVARGMNRSLVWGDPFTGPLSL